jgi:hypothetical protein
LDLCIWDENCKTKIWVFVVIKIKDSVWCKLDLPRVGMRKQSFLKRRMSGKKRGCSW